MLKKIISRKFKRLLSMKTLFIVINVLFVLSVILMFLLLNVDVIIKCILFVVVFLIYKAIENLLADISREKQKIITVNKRFTHKNDDTGAIEVKKEDFQQAILYLYEIENSIANNIANRE